MVLDEIVDYTKEISRKDILGMLWIQVVDDIASMLNFLKTIMSVQKMLLFSEPCDEVSSGKTSYCLGPVFKWSAKSKHKHTLQTGFR